MRKELKLKNDNFIVSIAFANYLKDKSGVPKVMMAHQQMYNNKHISYVALFAVKKMVLHDRCILFCKFGLIIDGDFIGVFQMSQILELIAKWYHKDRKFLLDIHIHHLMYIKLNLIDTLLDSCRNIPIKVYLHDYYNACVRFNLINSNGQYCGGAGLNEQTCAACKYFNDSVTREKAIHALFAKYQDRITFISPSDAARRIFLNFHPEYSDQTIVIPHQKKIGLYTDNLNPLSKDERIRIAYMAMPTRSKGWSQWRHLVRQSDPQIYEFIVFNSSDETYEGCRKVKIEFTPDNLNAMADAVRQGKIHAALLWAPWPETYSYTCFEAYSANAFIITSKNSGNIADVVLMEKNGIVLDSDRELYYLFKNPETLRNRINHYRASTQGGPFNLVENDEIVTLTLNGISERGTVVESKSKPVNVPLLWVLNNLYK